MKFKKMLSLIAAGALMTGLLAGCSKPATDAPATEAPAGEQVEVDIFQFKVEFKDAFEALAMQYQEINPDVKINITTVGGGENYGAALRSKFASGSEPAIFNVGGPQDVEDWNTKLADLSDTASAGLALPGTLDSVKFDGQTLGLPFNQEGYGFIYNKAIFEKAGIDPKSLTSFAALEQAVMTLDQKKAELGIDAVFAFPVKETWVTGLHLSSPFFAAEFDGNMQKTFEAKEIEFKYNEQMKKLVDLENTYSVQPTLSLDYSQQVEELFSNSKVAMIQQGNWAYGSIEGIDEEFAMNNIGIIPMSVEGYKEGAMPVGIPMYWGVNKGKDEAVVKASKDFIDWLYTSDEGKTAVLEDFKFIPAYDGYDTTKISDPLSKEIYEYAKAGNTINWVFMGYPTDWGMNMLGADIQQYVEGSLSWEQLVENAKMSWAEARQ